MLPDKNELNNEMIEQINGGLRWDFILFTTIIE